ncbi:hypothetical protein JCGZ_05081 [Jatropha curcas]|uniref:Aminotransferase-like plant mobile domain-containing protein n=1 Tax=Jatropha curcas TaxID=180498 RepID=A0A067JCP2_JATCU|nr:hypothetical protein JCGZ_05081 [Jatropha curcas]
MVLACLRDLSQVGSFDWATLGLAHLYHGLDVWTRGSGESNWLFIQPLELFLTPWDCEAWRTYPGREVAELHTRSRLLMRGYWADRYFLGERVFDTPVAPAQRRGPQAPPRHMCLLEGLTREDLEVEYRAFSANDFLSVGDSPLTSPLGCRRGFQRFLSTLRCRPRGIRRSTSGSGLPDPTSVGSTLMYISGISRQYGMIQRVPRIHNFESGLITLHLLTNLADRWRN